MSTFCSGRSRQYTSGVQYMIFCYLPHISHNSQRTFVLHRWLSEFNYQLSKTDRSLKKKYAHILRRKNIASFFHVILLRAYSDEYQTFFLCKVRVFICIFARCRCDLFIHFYYLSWFICLFNKVHQIQIYRCLDYYSLQVWQSKYFWTLFSSLIVWNILWILCKLSY